MCLVLVVEDDSASQKLIETVLERAGYKVITARDGYQALEIARSMLPALIMMNDGLPFLSGGEACRHLKDDELTGHIPVILVSAGTRLHDPSYVRATGADNILFKPCLPSEILAVVKAYV